VQVELDYWHESAVDLKGTTTEDLADEDTRLAHLDRKARDGDRPRPEQLLLLRGYNAR